MFARVQNGLNVAHPGERAQKFRAGRNAEIPIGLKKPQPLILFQPILFLSLFRRCGGGCTSRTLRGHMCVGKHSHAGKSETVSVAVRYFTRNAEPRISNAPLLVLRRLQPD